MLEKGGPIADALGKDGVLKALGKQGVLGALGKQGVLGALGKQGVLGALGKGGVIGALKGSSSVSSAVDLVRDAINGTGSVKAGGLNFAIGSVGRAINGLNSSKGISGAVGDVAVAVAGVKGAIIALNTNLKDRQRAERLAAKAEAKAERIRQRETGRLDAQSAAAELTQKHQSYNSIYGQIDLNAMTWLARSTGMSETAVQSVAKGWSDWAIGMLGGFNENESLSTLEKTMTLVADFKNFLTASAKGQAYPHDGAWYADEFRKLDGSHKEGLSFVPFDGYRAELHRGERVLTATEARQADSKSDEAVKRLLHKVLEELQIANKQRGAVAMATLEKADKVITQSEAQTRAIKRISI